LPGKIFIIKKPISVIGWVASIAPAISPESNRRAPIIYTTCQELLLLTITCIPYLSFGNTCTETFVNCHHLPLPTLLLLTNVQTSWRLSMTEDSLGTELEVKCK
jgi:hypothetical protein